MFKTSIRHTVCALLITITLLAGSTAKAFGSGYDLGQALYAYHDGEHLVGIVQSVSAQTVTVFFQMSNGQEYPNGGFAMNLPLDFVNNNFSKETDCLSQICKNDIVYVNRGAGGTSVHWVGRVTRLFENGTFEISWMTKNGRTIHQDHLDYLKSYQLFRAINCSTDICMDDMVSAAIGSNNYYGRVHRVFENDLAEVDWLKVNGIPESSAMLFYVDVRILELE